MNPLPNIIVIDFCDWLRERIANDGISPLELFANRDNYERLETYSKHFLAQRRKLVVDCPIRFMYYNFLYSKEFENIIKKCKENCPIKETHFKNCTQELEYCFYHCLRTDEIHRAYRSFCKKIDENIYYLQTNNVSYYDLAAYMRDLVYIDSDVKKSPQFMRLMMDSHISITDELEFFEWLYTQEINPTSINKMPSILFENLVDEYINFNKKGEYARRQLLKAYRKTGWEALLERFRVLFQINSDSHTKKLDVVMNRYFSRYASFNCIILPLSDHESQKEYISLITDNWYDLNELSADYLDIYYSETDNGKSGYDIAKRISSLPDNLKKKAPCLVLWKHSIKEAKTISIDELNSKQILSVIRSVVEKIQEGKDLYAIVEEVVQIVKNQQEINHGATIINVKGDGNVIGDNNSVNTTVINGDDNIINFSENKPFSQAFIEELDQAIAAINESLELDYEQKNQLLEILQDAKVGTIEKSIEKSEKAKNAFNYIKSFLVKTAPTLISVFANFTQIASFFGL